VPACPHCPGAAISADGYCESCGRRAPAARDHAESDLGWLAGVTDRGHRHYRNEDAMAVAVADTAAGPVAVAVVCDGVSGSDRGDEASQAATDAALAVLLPAARAGEDATDASTRAVQAAQAAVAALSASAGSVARHDSPSATFVSAVVTSGLVTVCWLGDSRAYWLDSGPEPAAQQLTADDSVAAELVAAGALSADEAASSPQAHVVTGWLGAELSGTSPHLAKFVPHTPGAVLLCSDGLWNYLTDASDLARRARSPHADPIGTARRLVDFALAAGGADNVTVVVASFPPAGTEPASQPARTPTEPIARSPDD
jgi:serine/threonine protein phosphatase PrpC